MKESEFMINKTKKNITITKKEHDAWHKKRKGYEGKNSREHALCHKKMGIKVKR